MDLQEPEQPGVLRLSRGRGSRSTGRRGTSKGSVGGLASCTGGREMEVRENIDSCDEDGIRIVSWD